MKTYKWFSLILAFTVLMGTLLLTTAGAKDPDDEKLQPPISDQLPLDR